MMKKFIPNFKIDTRQTIASKFVIIFSFSVCMFFSIYHFFYTLNNTLFLMNFAIGIMIAASVFFTHKKSMHYIAKIVLMIMMLEVVFIILFSRGADNTYLWVFIGFFYFMFLYGHKKGLIYTGIFFIVIFSLMFNFIGESITTSGYIRFIAVSMTLIAIAFGYEYSTQTTLARLEKTQKELEGMLKTDSLTTLFNRRYFDEIFPKQIRIAKRSNRVLIFLMADLDYFKNYNDAYGHQAGDEVLKAVSLSFKETMKRPDDYVFRLGGEEFGILFQVDDKEEGLKQAEKLRKNIESLKIVHERSSVSAFVTVSLGLYAIKPTNKYDCDDIYKFADDALYSAKQKGRNTIEEL